MYRTNARPLAFCPHCACSGVPLLIFAIALSSILGCAQAKEPPRQNARGAVLTLARAVHEADRTCAEFATSNVIRELARSCATGYAIARPAVVAAADAVDAWNLGRSGEVLCAIARAADGLEVMAKAMRAEGADVPYVVDDALALAAPLKEACHGG
jgi:hypothetical protein